MKITYCLIVFLFVIQGSFGQNMEPVNSNASKEAKALLAYIYSIKGKNLLSGQHNYAHELLRSSDSIFSTTGKRPAIWGSDLAGLNEAVVEQAISHYKKGGIVTLMYHQANPMHLGKDVRRPVHGRVSDEEWELITTPGNRYYDYWLQEIDKRAELLKKLRDAHIPVLWRPYHEMNGMWFWYGNRPGKDGVQKLWKMMYDRYVNYHHLDNLIWVWNTNAPRDWKDDEAYAYDGFYPGDDYVDILAADIYKADYKQSHHDDLLKLANGKPIALGECGVVPTPEILKKQPQWTWFMIWARFNFNHNEPEQIRALYSYDKVLTLDEIQNRK